MFIASINQTVRVTAAALLAATNLYPVTANAAEAAAPQVTVRYSATDLASAASVARLHLRLSTAAHQVCAGFEARELARHRIWQDCVAKALTVGVGRIHNPVLTAYHLRKTGTGRVATVVADLSRSNGFSR